MKYNICYFFFIPAVENSYYNILREISFTLNKQARHAHVYYKLRKIVRVCKLSDSVSFISFLECAKAERFYIYTYTLYTRRAAII